MLTKANRLVSSQVFAAVVRRGRRAGTRTLVLHLLVPPPSSEASPQVGYVVSKAVGPAVTRNLVKRRLRHLSRGRLDTLPTPCALVVRALPTSATASVAELAEDFDRALRRLAAPVAEGNPR